MSNLIPFGGRGSTPRVHAPSPKLPPIHLEILLTHPTPRLVHRYFETRPLAQRAVNDLYVRKEIVRDEWSRQFDHLSNVTSNGKPYASFF